MSKLALVEITDPTSPAAGELERCALVLAERCRLAGWTEECFAALYVTVQLARARGDTAQINDLGQQMALVKPQDPFPPGLLGQGPAVAWPQGFVQPAGVNAARRAIDRLLAQLDGLIPPGASPPAEPPPAPVAPAPVAPAPAPPPSQGEEMNSEAALAQMYMQESVEAPFPSELDDPLLGLPGGELPGLPIAPPQVPAPPGSPVAQPPGFLPASDADELPLAVPAAPAPVPDLPPFPDGLGDLAGLDLAGLDEIPLDALDPLGLGAPLATAPPPATPAPPPADLVPAPAAPPLDQADRSLLVSAERVHRQLVEQLVGVAMSAQGNPATGTLDQSQLVDAVRVCGLAGLSASDVTLILRKARDGD